jgi:hypothetical protein
MQNTYFLCIVMDIFKSWDTGEGGGGVESCAGTALAQLAAVTQEERGGGDFTGLAHNSCQSTLHRSQWEFIFPIGHISFRIRPDSMLKLIRNYINPNGLTVYVLQYFDTFVCILTSWLWAYFSQPLVEV